MKYFIILFFAFSCSSRNPVVPQSKHFYSSDTIRIDTVKVHPSKEDSLIKVIKTLNTQLFISKFQIERVRYYLKIVQRRPSQVKFLVSWINRAIK